MRLSVFQFKLPFVHLSFLLLFTVSVLTAAFPSHVSAQEQAVESNLRIVSADYETLNPETNQWQRLQISWAVNRLGFWHHWETQYKNFKYHVKIEVHEDLTKKNDSHYLVINMPGSFIVKLDGETIARNGSVSSLENGCVSELKPGKNRSIFPIPNHLLNAGIHEFDLIGYRSPRWVALYHAGFQIKDLNELMVQERWHIINYGSYLVYFVFGVFFLSNFITRRDSLAQFYLGAICLLFSTYAINKVAYYHLELSYQQAALAMNLVYALNYVIGFLAHLLVFEALNFRRVLAWALIPIPIALSWYFEAFDSYGVLKIVYMWLTLVAAIGCFQKRPYAITAVIVLITLSVVYGMRLFEKQKFIIYFAIFLYLLFSIALAFYKQHKEKQEAKLTNARLNLELVKNKIQPHFVLNSITSAMEWIESNPKQGATFLNALAKEFEVLSKMTEKKLIPLGMEVESCKNYLKVMEYRKKAAYELVTDGVDLAESLPPSIIRNLLENAISHNSFGKRSVQFVLDQQNQKKRRIYKFSSPCTCESIDAHAPEDGTGIQYIKARLMESYKKNWTFQHGLQGDNWVTTIEIF